MYVSPYWYAVRMSTADSRLPIWVRPEPGTRRPRFTREQIAATALADRGPLRAFEAVSMRRIAAELGAGTMTLYHYVRTKDDLKDLLDDAIVGEALVPDGRAAVRLARSAHRDRPPHPRGASAPPVGAARPPGRLARPERPATHRSVRRRRGRHRAR